MHPSHPPISSHRPIALSVLVALATVFALLAAPPAAAQEADEHEVTPARVAGEDRFHTAAALATLEFDTADNVFIAYGGDFADALAASYAAGRAGVERGPILLTEHRDLTDATRAALDELAPARVFVLGGPAAVHPDVVAELESREHDEVVRIAGEDRYETAADIAFAFGTSPHGEVGTLDGDRTALLANGEVFPDALSAGPIAAHAAFPLLLTPPDQPRAEVDARLDELAIERVVVVGGTAAVSEDVVLHYAEQGYEVERWGGASRTETAAVVADNARLRLGFDVALTLLARGDAFPDALTASVHAGTNASPILLTEDPHTLGTQTSGWLSAQCPSIEVIRALGGTAAITGATLDDAVTAAERCAEEPATWTLCHNPDQGYTVEHPADWFTNEEPRGELGPCSVFDPDPQELEWDHQEIPESIGVIMHVDDVAFERTDPDEQFEEELTRRDTTVDGRRAMRVETRATGEGRRPEGTLTTSWRVRLGEQQTFIASSHSIGEPSYEHKVDVLDRMIGTIDFDEPADEPATEPIGEPSTAERDSGDMPNDNEPADLVDVRTGVHEDLDRVVMEFTGPERPGWQVSWVDQPHHGTTGEPMAVRGEAYLHVEFHFARAFESYDGPERIAVDGNVITEVVYAGDDGHGLVSWVIGLEEEVPFATAFLQDPLRFVLDAVPR